MAKNPKNITAKKKESVQPVQFVTIDQLDKFGEKLLDAVESRLNKFTPAVVDPAGAAPDPAAAAAERKVTAAGPNKWETNPAWQETAEEYLGEYLDHTEVAYDKSGGIKFTIVIKTEKSNADKDYLRLTGSDRRTKEVGSEGLEGVIEWCKLVRANLKRGKAIDK